MSDKTRYLIAILAGGASSRMQFDKATILWQGVPLIEYVAGISCRVGQTVVVGRPRPADWNGPDIEFLIDDVPDSGPIGGLIAALKHAHDRPVLLVAVDMPLMSGNALSWLTDQEVDGDGIAVVYNGQIEPLFSVYTHSALPLLEAAVIKGRRSLIRCIEGGDFRKIDIPEELACVLTNVNTPEELERAIKAYSGNLNP